MRLTAPLLVLFALNAVLLFVSPQASSSGLQTVTSSTRPVRVGLVFDVGGRGDKSFNDAAYAGLEKARRDFGVEVEYIEPTGAEDREAALRIFAARGFDLVIGVGFIFTWDILAIAPEYPSTWFAGIDFVPPQDGKLPRNVIALKFREEEGSFLIGAAAALTSKSGRVGFVGGMDIPLIHKFEAGYRAGVRAVCESCKVSVSYAGLTPEAFKDPTRGKELALAQGASGVDVIFHASGSTGLGVFEGARSIGIKAIGVDADQYADMPGVVVTSMIKRVDVAVVETVRRVQQKRALGGVSILGLAEDGIDWVHDGPHALMDTATVSKVEALRGRVERHEINVPSTREALASWRMPP